MSHYDVVIFDAGGTLIGLETPDFFEQFFVIAARELGYLTTLDAVKEAVARVTGGQKWSVSGCSTSAITRKRMSRQLRVPVSMRS